jgi:SAM-dependent methyltransferase
VAPTPRDWQRAADRLAARSLADGDPTGWFDRLYRAGTAGEVEMPWDRTEPYPLLAEWADGRDGGDAGRRAVVVGCGLGADAEYVASLGFTTVAFDVSPEAIRLARDRSPGSPVDYVVGDLLDPRPEWIGAFDLVIEIWTAQALPDPPRARAIATVGRLVAPGGTLLAIALRREDDEPAVLGPPWPLTPAEIESFAGAGLTPVRIERGSPEGRPTWRAEFSRPVDAGR